MFGRQRVYQFIVNPPIARLAQVLPRPQLQPVLARGTVVSPLDFEEHNLTRLKRIIPAQPHLLARADAIQVRRAIAQQRVIKINAPHRRHRLVVNQPPAIALHQPPKLTHVRVRQNKFRFPPDRQILPCDILPDKLKQTRPNFLLHCHHANRL